MPLVSGKLQKTVVQKCIIRCSPHLLYITNRSIYTKFLMQIGVSVEFQVWPCFLHIMIQAIYLAAQSSNFVKISARSFISARRQIKTLETRRPLKCKVCTRKGSRALDSTTKDILGYYDSKPKAQRHYLTHHQD